VNQCKSYDPSKDFMPPLFGGLAFPDGTTSYIGARTSRGKTTAMVNLTREALKTNRKTLFITVEMSGKQIMNKLILSTAFANGIEADAKNRDAFIAMKPQIDIYAVWKEAELSGNGANLFRHYVQSAKNMITEQSKSFILYDARGANLAEIIDFINSNSETGTIVILDYIQKMPAKLGTDTDSFRKVQTISYEVVNAAAKTNSVIIAGAQFNRLGGTDGLGDCFSDQSFREAGDIEQDAHNAIGLGWKLDKQGRFYEVLKTREDRKQGTLYNIDFEGGYSYMAHGKEIRRSDYEKPTKVRGGKNETTETETPKSNINPATGKIDWENK
jgi:replicative DNA helicase